MSDCQLCSRIREWVNKPFDENGSAFDWFLFVGLIGSISWFWSRVLVRILGR